MFPNSFEYYESLNPSEPTGENILVIIFVENRDDNEYRRELICDFSKQSDWMKKSISQSKLLDAMFSALRIFR